MYTKKSSLQINSIKTIDIVDYELYLRYKCCLLVLQKILMAK
jgi:hypothetical protein